ncbi:MAG: tyrosine-type recombinase/integrase [Deltaproteobacteria bacterium]|nr:tyrosine-type recombinase/integrase [Deltaproteobacteria bacterium]
MGITFGRHSKEPGKAVWVIDWWPEGRNGPRRRKHFEGTREDAELYEQSVRSAAGLNRIGTAKTIFLTLEAVLPEYLRWHQLNRMPTTHADVKQSMPRLMQIFGKITVAQIKPGHITDFVSMRPDRKRSNQKEIHYLRGMITWMVKQGYAAPLHFKPETPKYHRPLPQVPMPGEVNAVLRQITDPVKKALIILMWTTGGRITSTAQIRWEDVNWERGTITVRVKGGRALQLPLPDEFRELMFDRRQTAGWVFLNPKTGLPLKSIKTILATASKKAGLPYKMTHHKFRHAYATDTLEATGDLRLVQNALGHTNISTTTIYTLVQTRRLVDAQDKVAEMRKGK